MVKGNWDIFFFIFNVFNIRKDILDGLLGYKYKDYFGNYRGFRNWLIRIIKFLLFKKLNWFYIKGDIIMS